MGSMSLMHWVIVGVIVLLLFGGGSRLADTGKGLGEGIRAFKKGLQGDEAEPEAIDPQKQLTAGKKKVIQVEVDDDDDDDAIAAKVAKAKKTKKAKKNGDDAQDDVA